MCERDTYRVITVSDTFSADACLAEELVLLNGRGIRTINSCCQHGKKEGFIEIQRDSTQQALHVGYDVHVIPEQNLYWVVPRGVDWGRLGPLRKDQQPVRPGRIIEE